MICVRTFSIAKLKHGCEAFRRKPCKPNPKRRNESHRNDLRRNERRPSILFPFFESTIYTLRNLVYNLRSFAIRNFLGALELNPCKQSSSFSSLKLVISLGKFFCERPEQVSNIISLVNVFLAFIVSNNIAINSFFQGS